MYYFEVLYSNCFGNKMVALVATPHATPETPTVNFNFGWNGNALIKYRTTDKYSYVKNIFRFYIYK